MQKQLSKLILITSMVLVLVLGTVGVAAAYEEPPGVPGGAQIQLDIQLDLERGWNMVSVPVSPTDTSTTSVFPGVAVVYAYNSSTRSYYIPTDIEPARGYWVAVVDDTPITISGSPVTSWTTEITTGWNMVGSIYEDVEFTDPDDDPDGSVEGFAYWWNPVAKSYDFTRTLEPTKGYWVAATQDCQLTVS